MGHPGLRARRRSRVRALTRDGKLLAELPRRKDDFFEALIPSAKERPAYRVEVETAHGTYSTSTLTLRPGARPARRLSAREGTHRQLYRRLGAQLITPRGRRRRALRASGRPTRARLRGRRLQRLGRPALPDAQARRQRPVGDLRPRIDGRRGLQVRDRRPGRRAAAAEGRSVRLRGASSGPRPPRSSPTPTISPGPTREYMASAARASRGASRCRSTRSISARGGAATDGRFLTYDELADQLIPYVADLGFTHLELLPITEHPLDASWGYQPIGLFAPTRRFGEPAGFARFVDRAHARRPRRDPRLGAGAFPDRRARPRAFRRHRALRARRSAQGLPSRLEHRDLQFRPQRGRELPLLQRALLGRALPHRRAARRCRRLDALPRLFAPRGRMAAQRRRRQREPRGDRLPPARQRARLRRLSRRGHDRRGIDRLARRLAADRPRRPRLRLQVEHGLDARHAGLHVARIRSIAAGITTR